MKFAASDKAPKNFTLLVSNESLLLTKNAALREPLDEVLEDGQVLLLHRLQLFAEANHHLLDLPLWKERS